MSSRSLKNASHSENNQSFNAKIRKTKLFSLLKASFCQSKSIDVEKTSQKSSKKPQPPQESNNESSSLPISNDVEKVVEAATFDNESRKTSVASASSVASGLINYGNTCYINSIVQCLNVADNFRDFLMFHVFPKVAGETSELTQDSYSMLRVVSELLLSLWDSVSDSEPSLRRFRAILGKCDANFDSDEQQDAQELLLFLLNHLHEALKPLESINGGLNGENTQNTSNKAFLECKFQNLSDLMRQDNTIDAGNTSKIHSMFASYQQTTISCPNCNERQNKLESSFCLSLPIPADLMRPFLYCFVEKDGFQIVAGMWINTATSVGYIRQNVAHRFRVDPSALVIMGVDEKGFGKFYQDDELASDLLLESTRRKSQSAKKYYKYCSKTMTKCGILNVLKKETINESCDANIKEEYDADQDDDIDSVFIDSSKYNLWDGVVVMELHRNVHTSTESFRSTVGTNQNRSQYSFYDSLIGYSSSSLHDIPNQSNGSTRRFSGYYDNIPKELIKGHSKIQKQPNSLYSNSHQSSTNPKLRSQNNAYEMEYDSTRTSPSNSSSLMHLVVIHVEEVDSNIQRYNSTSAKYSDECDWRRFTAPLSLLLSREIEFPDLYAIVIRQLETVYKCNIHSKVKFPLKFYVWDGDDENEDDNELSITMQYPLLSEQVELAVPLLSPSLRRNSDASQNLISDISLVRLVVVWSGGNAARLMQSVFRNLRVQQSLPRFHIGSRKTECLSLQDAWPGGVQENGSVENLRKDIKLNYASSKGKTKFSKKNNITIYNCLKAYTSEEVLDAKDAWYCPVCSTFQRATMCTRIYKPPEYLVLHLKRFQHQSFLHPSVNAHNSAPQHVMGGNNSYHTNNNNTPNSNYEHTYTNNKLNVLVDYPITGLDITPFMSKDCVDSNGADKHRGSRHLYDLFAVCNHQGTISAGHYTAFCLSSIDNKWRQYNDDIVTDLDLHKIVDSNAYILFYKKRDMDVTNKDVSFIKRFDSLYLNKTVHNNQNGEHRDSAIHGDDKEDDYDDEDNADTDPDQSDDDSYDKFMLQQHNNSNSTMYTSRQCSTLPLLSMPIANRNVSNYNYPTKTQHCITNGHMGMNGRPIQNGYASSSRYCMQNSRSNTISVPSRDFPSDIRYENGYSYDNSMRYG